MSDGRGLYPKYSVQRADASVRHPDCEYFVLDVTHAMARSITWYRLFRGKVWHVGFAQDAAACGSERPADAETVGERAPVNARVCGDCVATVRHLYALVLAAEAGDPRKPFDPWAAGEALIATEDILCVTCGRPDHEGRLCAADDLAEWPCGSCGRKIMAELSEVEHG